MRSISARPTADISCYLKEPPFPALTVFYLRATSKSLPTFSTKKRITFDNFALAKLLCAYSVFPAFRAFFLFSSRNQYHFRLEVSTARTNSIHFTKLSIPKKQLISMTQSPQYSASLRANVTKKNGEISCSVEETNRIRAALGLRPLRTNVLSEQKHSTPPLRPNVTSKSGEISCSVEETNRIRASLGLKPLRTSPSEPSVKAPPKEGADTASALRERVSKARSARKARVLSVAAQSIAEEGSDGDSSEDDPDEDIAKWVKASREKEQAKFMKKGMRLEPASRKDEAVLKDAKQVVSNDHVKHVPPNSLRNQRNNLKVTPPSSANRIGPQIPSDVPDNNATLVLADSSVTNEKDVLEHVSKQSTRLRDAEINGAKYDGTDTKEFTNAEGKRGGLSVAKQKMEIDNDYTADLNADKVFAKRKRERKALKKRKRTVRTAQIPMGRMEELRRKERKRATGDSDDEDGFYESLARAKKKARRTEVNRSVSTILEAINKANEIGENGGEALEDAENIVYGEMEQFLQTLPTAEDDNTSGDEMDISREGDDRTEHEVDANVNQEAASGHSGKVEQGKEETKPTTSTGPSTSEDEVLNSKGNDEPDDDSSIPKEPSAEMGKPVRAGQSGMAGFLASLRTSGDLSAKHEQLGRAKDKRFDEDEENLGDGEEKEIKLRYTDEHGNELTRKEAFRLLCHKFHGNGPGQNKREKRLKRMLDNIKRKTMLAGDTPLASAAALKNETKRAGKAHVVLSKPTGGP